MDPITHGIELAALLESEHLSKEAYLNAVGDLLAWLEAYDGGRLLREMPAGTLSRTADARRDWERARQALRIFFDERAAQRRDDRR